MFLSKKEGLLKTTPGLFSAGDDIYTRRDFGVTVHLKMSISASGRGPKVLLGGCAILLFLISCYVSLNVQSTLFFF